MSLESFKNAVARDLFGMSLYDAHERGICISCKNPQDAEILSDLDLKEYKISGLCSACWDSMTRIKSD